MNTMFTFIVVIQVLSALSIIGLVLLQQGKGADMGAAFGTGASGSLFGASGSANFLSKSTAFAAVVFFASTLALAFLGSRSNTGGGGVMDRLQSAPAATVPAPAQNSGEAPGQNQVLPSVPAPANGGQSNQIPK